MVLSGDRFFRSLIAELFIGTIATCTPYLRVDEKLDAKTRIRFPESGHVQTIPSKTGR
jgi:hypothetical protein